MLGPEVQALSACRRRPAMKRKSFVTGVVWWIPIGCLLLASAATPAEKARPPQRSDGSRAKLYGDVKAVKNTTGRITAVTLVSVNKVTYKVTLDENGKKLGEAMSGKKAAVIGRVSGEGAERCLTVESYGEIKKAAKQEEKKTKTPPRRRPGTRKRSTRKRAK